MSNRILVLYGSYRSDRMGIRLANFVINRLRGRGEDVEFIDAKAIGLPIAPQYRANVIVNYERSMLIAKPLLEVELDDELTSAPVFRP